MAAQQGKTSHLPLGSDERAIHTDCAVVQDLRKAPEQFPIGGFIKQGHRSYTEEHIVAEGSFVGFILNPSTHVSLTTFKIQIIHLRVISLRFISTMYSVNVKKMKIRLSTYQT